MSDFDPHAFFKRYVAALNAHAFDRLTEFMHDDLIVNDAPATREDVIAGLEGHITAVPDLTWRVMAVTVEGERIAARFLNTGTPTGAWFDAKPTGKSVEYTEFVLHKVRDGRFSELTFLLDVAGVRDQLAG